MAGTSWSELADKLEDKQVDFGKQVRDQVKDDAIWRGQGADAAAKRAEDIYRMIKDQVPDLKKVKTALTEAAGTVATQKLRLEQELQEAKSAGFEVNLDTGRVEAPEGKSSADAPKSAEDYAAAIEGFVKAAGEADATAARQISGAINKLGDLQQVLSEERKEERAEGKELANRLTETLRAGKEPSPELEALLARNAGDEYFAAAMAKSLGTKGILDLPALIGQVEGLDKGETKDLMTSISTMVGTAANGEGPDMPPTVRQGLVEAAGSTELMGREDEPGHRGQGEEHLGYRKFWSMQKLLQFGEGEIGGQFLADVGEQVYNNRDELRSSLWDHDGSYDLNEDEWGRSGMGTGADPMLTVMDAMQESPEAGREFFGHDPNHDGTLDRVVNLTNDYPLTTPDGEHVSEALKNASTSFENSQIDPNRSTDPYKDAGAIASNYLHAAAEVSGGDINGPVEPAVRQDVASVLSYYYEDLHTTLNTNTPIDEIGAREIAYNRSPTEFQSGAKILSSDAESLVNMAWEDDQGKQQLLQAAKLYGEANLNYVVDHPWEVPPPASNEPAWGNPAQYGFHAYGEDLGRLAGAAHAEEIMGKSDSELLETFGGAALAAGSAVGGPLTAGLGEIAKAGLNELTPNPGEARGDMQQDLNVMRADSHIPVAEMMIRNGLWQDDWPPVDQYFNQETGRFEIPPDDPATERNETREFERWAETHLKPLALDQIESFGSGLESGRAEALGKADS